MGEMSPEERVLGHSAREELRAVITRWEGKHLGRHRRHLTGPQYAGLIEAIELWAVEQFDKTRPDPPTGQTFDGR